MKTSRLKFSLIGTICLYLGVQSVIAQENISWLSNYTSEIIAGSNTFIYNYKTIDNNECKISIEEKKTDKKGEISTMAYQLYLSDLNTSNMNVKTSGTTAIVNLEIKQSQKFISVTNNGKLEGYTNKIAINMSEIDKARSFIEAVKSKVENCNTSERKWTSRDETMKWLTENIIKSETSGTTYNQTFKAGGKSYLANLEVVSTDSKGVKQNMNYDFNLSDINPSKINMEVAGKTFKIELPTRENKNYIRLIKGTEDISYLKVFEIYSDDLEQARNLLNGLVFLVTQTPTTERKAWNSYTTAIGFIKENIGEVKNGTSTTGQWLNLDESTSGSAKFTSTKTDSKDVTSKNTKSFYLNDLQPTVNLEVSSKSISLDVTTKDKNKYIKESNENSTLAYTGSFEIFESNLEKARELKHALEYAIGKSEKGLLEFSNTEKAISWMTLNVGEVKIDAEKIEQSLKIISGYENRIDFKRVTTAANGSSVTEFFEIYPEDLKTDEIKVKVSGKKLAVLISTGKYKYIKSLKDNLQQNYTSDTEILFEDVLTAKNFITAIVLLREKSQVADRSMKDKVTSTAYIVENTRKIEVAGETFDQKIEQRENDNCKIKYTTVMPGSKGASVETIYEFNMYDIDPKNSEIAISSKNILVTLVTKNKEKLIKPYKNGEAGNFISSIEINVADVVVAKKLLAAYGSLANFCK